MGTGLSPRVRGNRMLCQLHVNKAGSIPACAGEPAPATRRRPPDTVYPRVCGGTSRGLVRLQYRLGLSPRVRGNPNGNIIAPLNSRSIPACAGEPSLSLPIYRSRPVYPRVCGGTPAIAPALASSVGLSPRVRGNPALSGPFVPSVRSIPACAGEPPSLDAGLGGRRVYPRVCGGTLVARTRACTLLGLSPRVRGNPLNTLETNAEARSIPACAGEPAAEPCQARSPKVYPRVCGGTVFSNPDIDRESGLSPRVRGNRSTASDIA